MYTCEHVSGAICFFFFFPLCRVELASFNWLGIQLICSDSPLDVSLLGVSVSYSAGCLDKEIVVEGKGGGREGPAASVCISSNSLHIAS